MAGVRCFLVFVALAGFTVAAGAQVRVDASVDNLRPVEGEYVTYTVTVDGGGTTTLPRPRIPSFNGFRVIEGPRQAQNMSFSNGQVSATLSISYVLQPTRKGSLTIAPAIITSGGQTISSNPVTIEVGAPRPTPATRSGDPADTSNITGDLHLKAIVDNTNPYVGERVHYRWVLYLSARAENVVRRAPAEWPSFRGFITEAIEKATQQRQMINGQRYLVVERHYALYPNSPGQITIPPAKAKMDYGLGSLFSGRAQGPRELTSNTVTLNVKPLPTAGKPRNFGYLVGSFKMGAGVDKQTLAAGDAVTLTLRITGEGNMRTIPDLDLTPLEQTGFRIFDPDISLTTRKESYPPTGLWEARVILVPPTEGAFTLPAFSMPFFDPATERYRTMETQPIRLAVTPGENLAEDLIFAGGQREEASPVEQLGRDINYLATEFSPQAADNGGPLYESTAFQVSLAFPPVLLLGMFVMARRRERLLSDEGYARRLLANSSVRKRLADAEAAMNENRPEDFYFQLSHALLEYIAHHAKRQAAGLTTQEVTEILVAEGMAPEQATQLRRLLDHCDLRRFGGGLDGDLSQEMADLCRQGTELLAILEEVLG